MSWPPIRDGRFDQTSGKTVYCLPTVATGIALTLLYGLAETLYLIRYATTSLRDHLALGENNEHLKGDLFVVVVTVVVIASSLVAAFGLVSGESSLLIPCITLALVCVVACPLELVVSNLRRSNNEAYEDNEYQDDYEQHILEPNHEIVVQFFVNTMLLAVLLQCKRLMGRTQTSSSLVSPSVESGHQMSLPTIQSSPLDHHSHQ